MRTFTFLAAKAKRLFENGIQIHCLSNLQQVASDLVPLQTRSCGPWPSSEDESLVTPEREYNEDLNLI